MIKIYYLVFKMILIMWEKIAFPRITKQTKILFLIASLNEENFIT